MSADQTRIVIAEDQPMVLKTLIKSLQIFPELEIVGTAQDGEAAVRETVALRPQLLLLDLEMPELDGIEVTKKVKLRAPEVEVLILTSFDNEQKVYEAIQAGASGYLVKRVGPEKIRTAIREVMEGGTVLEPLIAKRFWNYFQSIQNQTGVSQNTWALTEVELEVLRFVAKGLSNAEVGRVMTIERRTVRTHLSHIYRKMGVHSHVDAVVLAVRAGLVDI